MKTYEEIRLEAARYIQQVVGDVISSDRYETLIAMYVEGYAEGYGSGVTEMACKVQAILKPKAEVVI